MTVPAGISIRPATSDDYAAMGAIHGSAVPENPRVAEHWRHDDQTRDPKCRAERWMAEVDGHPVGFGLYDQDPWVFHPRKFTVHLSVLPEWQGTGIGKALYEHVLAALAVHRPQVVRTEAREDHPRAPRFLESRGFVEAGRDVESYLQVSGIDLTPYEGIEESLADQGILIRTAAELGGDPDAERKIWDLDMTCSRDIPVLPGEEPTPLSFETYRARILKSPRRIEDAVFVAMDGPAFVGLTSLWRHEGMPDLQTGLTAVRREYRRRGIATALKVRAVRYALEHGIPVIRTGNAVENRPMLAINERLGFVKQPAWVIYAKELNGEAI